MQYIFENATFEMNLFLKLYNGRNCIKLSPFDEKIQHSINFEVVKGRGKHLTFKLYISKLNFATYNLIAMYVTTLLQFV